MQYLLFIQSSNPEQVVRGRLLKGVASILLLSLLAIIAIVLALSTPESNHWVVPLLGVDFLACLIVFWLAHRGNVVAGGFLLCFTLIVVAAFVAATGQSQQPLNGIISYNYIFPLLIAGMVIGSWAIPLFGAMPLVAYVGLALIGRATQGQITPLVFVLMVAGIFWLIIRTLEGSLADARQQTRAAQSAEHDLQAQQQSLREANADLLSANEQMHGLLNLVRDLETPLIPVLDGVLVLPLIGHIDSARAERISIATMQAVHAQRARMLIIDLTGVSIVDTAVVMWMSRLSDAVRLLGVRPMVAGMHAEVAHTMVQQGVTLGNVQSVGRLQEGIQMVLREAV